MVAPFYRRAYANSKQAIEPLFRSRSGRGWSGAAARTTFRKELAQILHQPSQLIGLLFSAIVIVVMAGSRFLTDRVLGAGELPEPVRHCFLIVGLWLFAQLTIAPSCLFRLTVADGPQWPLYVGAPVARTTLLRGKLVLIALLQAWPAPIALVVGRVLYGADALALLLATAILPAALLWTTSLTAAIGTIPMLMKPDPERSNVLALLAVLIMLIALQLSVIPGIQAWLMLTDYYAGRGPLAALSPTQMAAVFVGGFWTLSVAFSAIALALGARNFARLARPATR